jgi:phosphatidate cytidylyltransferase
VAARPWRDLRLRAISAAVLGPLCLLCIWLGELPWMLLIAIGVGGLAIEWVHLCGGAVARLPGLLVPVAITLGCAVALAGDDAAGLGLLLLGAVLCWRAALRTPWPRALGLGVLYVGLMGIALIRLRGDLAAGRANVLFVVLVVWASDIGAYLVGRLFGGPRLAPAISPGKTWSGAAGGLLAALGVGILAASRFDSGVGGPPDLEMAAVVAVVLGLAAQAGDLAESFIKRRFGVKDSGRLIPGHGGLLDRLDGLLAAAPVAALLSLILGQGAYLWR